MLRILKSLPTLYDLDHLELIRLSKLKLTVGPYIIINKIEIKSEYKRMSQNKDDACNSDKEIDRKTTNLVI